MSHMNKLLATRKALQIIVEAIGFAVILAVLISVVYIIGILTGS